MASIKKDEETRVFIELIEEILIPRYRDKRSVITISKAQTAYMIKEYGDI